MKPIVLILLSFFYSISVYCQDKQYKNPPGTVNIGDNFYCDKFEVSNVDYREYIHWIGRIIGNDSHEYKEALVDTAIVEYDYYKNPRFNKYPLVGVTYEQAIKYCKWRSDRVYEQKLIKAGVIKWNSNQDKDNYFTIEKVLNGQYNLKKPKKLDKVPIPYYRLPTIKEWEFAATGGDSVSNTEGIDTVKIDQNKLFSENLIGLVDVNINEKRQSNKFGLLNMMGNVAEMVNEKGFAKGGFWANNIEKCAVKNCLIYVKAESWLGFRCVCEYK